MSAVMEVISMDDDWKEQAGCKNCRDLFFSSGALNLYRARRICIDCPVYSECLEWTLSNYPLLEDGILAGFSSAQRLRLENHTEKYRDWRDGFHSDSVCDHHSDLTYYSQNKKGDRYFICLQCGTKVKQLKGESVR